MEKSVMDSNQEEGHTTYLREFQEYPELEKTTLEGSRSGSRFLLSKERMIPKHI